MQPQIIRMLHVIYFYRIPTEHVTLLQKSANNFIFYILLSFYPALFTGIAPFFRSCIEVEQGNVLSFVNCLSAFTLQAERENQSYSYKRNQRRFSSIQFIYFIAEKISLHQRVNNASKRMNLAGKKYELQEGPVRNLTTI